METSNGFRHPRWLIFFLLIDIAGLFFFLLGFQPGIFGLNRSPVMGYLQAVVLLFGLGMVMVGTYAIQSLLRPVGQLLSILEDIGVRLSATGYVLFAVSTTADFNWAGKPPPSGSAVCRNAAKNWAVDQHGDHSAGIYSVSPPQA